MEQTNQPQSRIEIFAAVYAVKLVAAMEKEPQKWVDTPATAEILALRMTKGLAEGNANLSAQAKAAAKYLGIYPTYKAIREWLASK